MQPLLNEVHCKRKARMKLFLSISVIAMLLGTSGCNKKDRSELEGEWQLIEVLADPGDGSGTFQAVSSNKTIEFNSNGTITSNGDLCTMTETSGTATSGTYELVDSTITAGCVDAGIPITFKHIGNELIVSYPCFEACQHKYKKL